MRRRVPILQSDIDALNGMLEACRAGHIAAENRIVRKAYADVALFVLAQLGKIEPVKQKQEFDIMVEEKMRARREAKAQQKSRSK